MSQRGLVYSFVAKGTVVLAEHTSYSGNFSTIAVQCLQKLPSNSSKYTYSCDGYTFNFLIDNGFVFLVVAGESIGRSVPFVFLERVKDDFKQRYGESIKNEGAHPLADDEDDDEFLFEDRFSIAYSLDREFGPRLKEHMQYCMNHPEEMSKLSKLKAQITEVKGIMIDNIEKVLDRGEKIELLVDKTESLQFQADSFQRQGRQLRRKMWLQSLQMKLMMGGGILIIIVILWAIACGGFKC
ncbi:vesicle-associated membrane protein 727 [Neltuma alba]|uniref:vesicle-associated membrane protein 727 n=1 Tax=Neltuma alba TaxID=207710 RepID=UPI0010A30423|nr:vesicle-associated membrane protein 727 [Prosopis alba]XP_028799367.1 vesicle-associated membrane protein 727 [Prosopis alba]